MKFKFENLNPSRFAIYSTLATILLWVIFNDFQFSLVLLIPCLIYYFLSYMFFKIYKEQITREKDKFYNKKIKKLEKNIKNTNIEEWTKKKTQEIAQLKANEQFRKEFIGNVAHELKTPIFNIQGFIDTLLDGAINDPKVNIKYLERTEKNAQRLITIVKDLDTISKIETGAIVPEISTFDLGEVVSETLEIMEVKAESFGVKLIFKEPKNKILVAADKEKITEVINNLVLNSIIYGKKNGQTEVLLVSKKNKINVLVKDNGIGISQEDLTHIFERFFRVDKSRSRDSGGSGLGLAIVKHIIDAHNQTIKVESEVGKGTTFTFSVAKVKKGT